MSKLSIAALGGILACVVASPYEASAGAMYDMSIFLSQPYPFEVRPSPNPVARPVTRPAAPLNQPAPTTTQVQVQPQIPPPPLPGYGEPIQDQPVGEAEAEEEKGVWRIEMENEDSIGINVFETLMHQRFGEKTESGHLTWGWRVSFSPHKTDPQWLERIREDSWWPAGTWDARASYSLQQSAYLPYTYFAIRDRPDSPGAGYLLANVRLNMERDFIGNTQYLDRMNFGVGVVGPASGAEITHRVAHSGVGRSSRTWNEINSEPVVVLQYDTGKRWVWGADYLGFEVYPKTGVTLGNAFTHASLGLSTRFGSHLKKDSGPLRSNMVMSGTNFPQKGDYFSWNVFAGIEGRYVYRNIFIDGNTFSDTSNVESRRRAVDVQMGGEIGWGEKRFSMMHVYRSREFNGQLRADQFVRLGLSMDLSDEPLDVAKQKKGPLWGVISEFRLGALSHDVVFPSRKEAHVPNPMKNRYEEGFNINPEIVFVSPDMFDFLWAPRPHVGFTINSASQTSSVYSGLGWDTTWQNDVFLDGFFGLAAHNGKLTNGNPDRIEFGSSVLFRLGGELGWRWDEANGVSFIWEHMTNAGVIDEKNQGIDSLGIRYSYRFDRAQ